MKKYISKPELLELLETQIPEDAKIYKYQIAVTTKNMKQVIKEPWREEEDVPEGVSIKQKIHTVKSGSVVIGYQGS